MFRQSTRFRQAVSVERKVAITLWCLATPCEYRTATHLFGVARCTYSVQICPRHMSCNCKEINGSIYIEFPAGEVFIKAVDGFEDKWGFPQCIGAIDGSHVPIAAPEFNHTDYYNRKCWYSTIVQGFLIRITDIFRDICVGWLGSVHDARVFANSLIYRKITEDALLCSGECRTHLGTQVPLYLIGD